MLKIKEKQNLKIVKNYLQKWQKINFACKKRRPQTAMAKINSQSKKPNPSPSIEKMLIKNQANIILSMEKELEKKNLEFSEKQKIFKLYPIISRKILQERNILYNFIITWRLNSEKINIYNDKKSELENKLKLLKDEFEYIQKSKIKKKQETNNQKISEKNGDISIESANIEENEDEKINPMQNDSLLQGSGEDKLGMEYLAFIEHQNKDLEEKLLKESEEFKKRAEKRENELLNYKQKIKELLEIKKEQNKKKSEKPRPKLQLK